MPLSRTPLPAGALPVGVLRTTDAASPPQARMAAARGLLPMGPVDLCLALYQLALDADATVREAAAVTAGELPDRILHPALSQPLDARVLDFFAERLAGRDLLIEQIVLNVRADGETVCAIAKTASERLCEIIAVNEERLLRAPRIIEALYFNRNARMSTVDRLVELAARHGITLAIPAFQETAAALAEGAAATTTELEPTAPEAASPFADDFEAQPPPEVGEAAPGGLDDFFGEALGWGGDEIGLVDGTAPADLEGADDFEARLSGAKIEEKAKRISEMPINAKIRLATLGNMFHRSILIRDANKVVAMSAIASPAVTDTEAVRYAAMRSVSDDIVRYISSQKDWMRLYAVKKNLCNNAKCPLAISMRLLPHLRPPDLRSLMTSKNVPSALVGAAKQLLQQRAH